MNYKRSLSLHITKHFLQLIFSKKQNYSPIAATLGTTDGKSEGEIVEGTDDDEVTEEGTNDDDDAGATVDGAIVGL